MNLPLWLILALLSAAAAAVVPIFAKLGMKDANPDLVTVLRGIASCIVLLIFGTSIGVWRHLPGIGWKAGIFIALSGIAGAASWIFYFNAIAPKVGEVSWVAPIDKLSMPLAIVLAVLVLGERPSGINWFGIFLIAVGAYLATVKGPLWGR